MGPAEAPKPWTSCRILAAEGARDSWSIRRAGRYAGHRHWLNVRSTCNRDPSWLTEPVQAAGSWKCQMTSDGKRPAARAADGR
jgi:hypothetical protein